MSNFIFGDCMDKEIGLSVFPDKHFGLAIVDPPYGIGASRPTKKPHTVLQKNGNRLSVKGNEYTHKDWDDKLMSDKYFEEIHRVSKRVICWGANYQKYPLPGGRLIWDKLNGESDQSDGEIAYLSWTKRVEIVYYMWNGMFQGRAISKDIKIAYKQQGDKQCNEKRIHPTQKPTILYKWLLEQYATPGTVILDTHVGSGSSLIACELLGYEYVGYEIDKEYYDLTLNRLRNQKSILF